MSSSFCDWWSFCQRPRRLSKACKWPFTRSVTFFNRFLWKKSQDNVFLYFKGIVRPDWIYMRVVPLDRPWIGHQVLLVFDFLNFTLEYDFKVLSHFVQKGIQLPACLDHGLHRILSSCWLVHFYWWKNHPLKCCSILVWIAGCWNSLLTTRNPKNNWCLSPIFGARFGGKDRGLSTCKLWSKQTFRTLSNGCPF